MTRNPVPPFVSTPKFYELRSLSTKVLAASFTPVDTVRALTGIRHLTLLPQSLRQLAESSVSQQMPALWFHVAEPGPFQAPKLPREDRKGFLTGLKNGDGKERLDLATERSCEMQKRLDSKSLYNIVGNEGASLTPIVYRTS